MNALVQPLLFHGGVGLSNVGQTLDTDINEDSYGYSLEVKLHRVTEFEDHTIFSRLLSSSQLIGTN